MFKKRTLKGQKKSAGPTVDAPAEDTAAALDDAKFAQEARKRARDAGGDRKDKRKRARDKEKGVFVAGRGSNVLTETQFMEANSYRPKTKETKAAYEQLLVRIRSALGGAALPLGAHVGPPAAFGDAPRQTDSAGPAFLWPLERIAGLRCICRPPQSPSGLQASSLYLLTWPRECLPGFQELSIFTSRARAACQRRRR